MMKELSIDLETYSDIDISKCGTCKYAESDNFEILLFGVSVNNGPVKESAYPTGSGSIIPNTSKPIILKAIRYKTSWIQPHGNVQ